MNYEFNNRDKNFIIINFIISLIFDYILLSSIINN